MRNDLKEMTNFVKPEGGTGIISSIVVRAWFCKRLKIKQV